MMNWLVWKQHRKQIMILAVILALYAGIAVPMSMHLWHVYQQALASCRNVGDCSQSSSQLFQTGWSNILNPNTNGFGFLDLLVLAVPFAVGIFVGVPLIAREYSNKTNLLIWARSVSRRRWLTTKLVWMLFTVAVFAAGITLLTTFWSRAGNALYLNRFYTMWFDLQGFSAVGYAVLAVAIGIALGAWFKRTMAAVGVTLIIMLAVQIIVGGSLRPHYMTPVTKNITSLRLDPIFDRSNQSQVPVSAWITSVRIVNNKGQVLSWTNPPASCIIPSTDLPGPGNPPSPDLRSKYGAIVASNGGPAVGDKCLQSQGFRYVVKYQPAYRYWDFQRIELGLYLALSIIPVGATYWLVLRRDA